MPTAARVVLVPPKLWDEDKLVQAARSLAPPRGALRPGDAIGDLVVVRVEPEAGATVTDATTLDVLATPRPRKGPLHLAVLVDASDSMSTAFDASRSRLDAALEALSAFLFTGAGDVLTVLAYAKDPRVVAGPAPRAQFAPRVERPRSGGRAGTAAAIDGALAHLAAQSHEGPQAIVLLTDGASDETETRAAAVRAKRLGVQIHVVSFAPRVDPMLDEVAKVTGGTLQRAPSPPLFDITWRMERDA